MPPTVRVALVGDYDPAVIAHQAIPSALALAGTAVEAQVDGCWLATDLIGTLFQPERAALRGVASPPVSGLLRAALRSNATSPFKHA